MNKLELKKELEGKYLHQEAFLKRIECVYIPVSNAVEASFTLPFDDN